MKMEARCRLVKNKEDMSLCASLAQEGGQLYALGEAVGPRVTHHYDRAWTVAEGRKGQLVVIGLKGLDRNGVTRALLG